jgi:hypothetical protein
MKFFFDVKTKRRLAVLLKSIPNSVTRISAAVAFTQSDILVETCINKKISLEWWGLFNSEIASKLDIVRKAISSPLIKFYPFAEYFHPKVIVFHGYGIYVGSHNMTKSAMYDNVEAGVFIEENELTDEQNMELDEFFDYLKKNSVPATIEDVDRIDEYIQSTQIDNNKKEEIQTGLDDLFEEQFGHLFILKSGVRDYGREKGDTESKRKLHFLQEWREAQNYLSIVQSHVLRTCKQPAWVNPTAELTIITDQLLHAYYYTYLLKGNDEHKSIEIVNNEYEKNRRDPNLAIERAIRWWETLEVAPTSEDIHINEWSISNRKILGYLRERDLSQDEILTIMRQNHAARNHARQIRNSAFNLPSDFKTDIEKRVQIYVNWLVKQKTDEKLTVNDTMRYLLFNDKQSIEERVYESVYSKKYRLEHFGRSIIGELIGWGRPELTHLRNNRVNKALRCLGYDVRLFSE